VPSRKPGIAGNLGVRGAGSASGNDAGAAGAHKSRLYELEWRYGCTSNAPTSARHAPFWH